MSAELHALLKDPGIVWVGASLPETDLDAIYEEAGPTYERLKERTWEEFRQASIGELQVIEQQLLQWRKACAAGKANNLKLIHRYLHDDAEPVQLSQMKLTAIWGAETFDFQIIPDLGQFLSNINRQLKQAIVLLDFRIEVLRQLLFHRIALGKNEVWAASHEPTIQGQTPKRENIHRTRAKAAATILKELGTISSISDLAKAFVELGEGPVSVDTLSKSLQNVYFQGQPLYVPAKQGGTQDERDQAFTQLKANLEAFLPDGNRLTNEK